MRQSFKDAKRNGQVQVQKQQKEELICKEEKNKRVEASDLVAVVRARSRKEGQQKRCVLKECKVPR